ncbi:hypothetical protein Hanom_Chr09g00775551 [Helianthus anomalus]
MAPPAPPTSPALPASTAHHLQSPPSTAPPGLELHSSQSNLQRQSKSFESIPKHNQ